MLDCEKVGIVRKSPLHKRNYFPGLQPGLGNLPNLRS